MLDVTGSRIARRLRPSALGGQILESSSGLLPPPRSHLLHQPDRLHLFSVPLSLALAHLLQVLLELGGGLDDVALADDVVALEDGTRPVAADGHGDPLRHAGPDEVPDPGAAEVVEEEAGDTNL